MNYAYMIYSGKIDRMVYQCIKSLNKYNKCKILFYMVDNIQFNKGILSEFNNIEIIEIDPKQWKGKRMSCKIVNIPIERLQFGDKMFVMDTDLIIRGEIFGVLNDDIDVAITGRDHKYIWSINAGVWGINFNERSKQFLEFYQQQVVNPTWEPFVKFTSRYSTHYKNLDWWCDQDFLCVVNENKLPFECKVKDIGFKYNFCSRHEATKDKAIEEIKEKMKDEQYKIIHLKGWFKEEVDKFLT